MLRQLTCTTTHRCISATVKRHDDDAAKQHGGSAGPDITVRLAWDTATCNSGARRRRQLRTLDNVRLHTSRDASVVVRCGYTFAPAPWPGLAVAPLRFLSSAEEAAQHSSLAQAYVLLHQLRLGEAQVLVAQLLDGNPQRELWLAAQLLQVDISLLLGDLDSARHGLALLTPHVRPAQQARLDTLADMLAVAEDAAALLAQTRRQDDGDGAADGQAAGEGQGSVQGQDCEAVGRLAAIARANRTVRLAQAKCCFAQGEDCAKGRE